MGVFNSCFLVQAAYPVPTPPHGRQAVHGWLILPLDSSLPQWKNTTAPVDAWLSHHVPEFYTTSPHDFQIVLRGHLTPLPHAGDVALPLQLPYPPHHELIEYEYTFTPPPPFSLNSLLNGQLTKLQGVVYNGSFDTTYERIPTGLAQMEILELTTARYLNYSSAVQPFPHQTYYSYPRSPVWNNQPVQHLYMAHFIHDAPDFDQFVHVTLDLTTCTPPADPANSAWVSTPGQVWTFDRPNTVDFRLLPSLGTLPATTVHADQSQTTCSVTILEEIHCMVGPGFSERCPDL